MMLACRTFERVLPCRCPKDIYRAVLTLSSLNRTWNSHCIRSDATFGNCLSERGAAVGSAFPFAMSSTKSEP